MVIQLELTRISKCQWFKVAKVFAWVGISAVVAMGLVFITNKAQLLPDAYVAGTVAAINVIGVMIAQILTNDTKKAIQDLPVQDQAPVQTVVEQLQQ